MIRTSKNYHYTREFGGENINSSMGSIPSVKKIVLRLAVMRKRDRFKVMRM